MANDTIADSEIKFLTKADFDTYTQAWINAVEHPAGDSDKLFTTAAGNLMTGVSFSLTAIAALLSTVRAQYIEARFLVIPPQEAGGHPQFSLALYATDADYVRISAYYQATSFWDAPVTGEPAATSTATDQAPYALVKGWLEAWATAPELKQEMFRTSFGTLEGYRFRAADFMQPFFEVQNLTGMDVRVDLGLHGYYPADSENLLTGQWQQQQTFGLVLRLSLPLQAAAEPMVAELMAAAMRSTSPFFDLSTPCPPGT